VVISLVAHSITCKFYKKKNKTKTFVGKFLKNIPSGHELKFLLHFLARCAPKNKLFKKKKKKNELLKTRDVSLELIGGFALPSL
jgi:hypothetical protein